MKEKKRVNPVEVEHKYDFYNVKTKYGVKHTVYAEDYDMMVRLLMEVDDTDPHQASNGCIFPQTLADKVCEIYPSLKTKLLRPTGKYYKKYHLALKILDYYRYIDYYKDGSIKKHDKFRKITPRTHHYGLDKWIE